MSKGENGSVYVERQQEKSEIKERRMQKVNKKKRKNKMMKSGSISIVGEKVARSWYYEDCFCGLCCLVLGVIGLHGWPGLVIIHSVRVCSMWQS